MNIGGRLQMSRPLEGDVNKKYLVVKIIISTHTGLKNTKST